MAGRGGPPPQKGTRLSQPKSGPSSRTGLRGPEPGRIAPNPSRVTQPSSVTKMQTSMIRQTISGTKIQAQSKTTTSTVTKLPSKSGPSGSPASGSARIRMATRAAPVKGSNVQTTKVLVKGAGLKPTGKAGRKTCNPTCSSSKSKIQESPVRVFDEEMERGRPVPPGTYYIPIAAGLAEKEFDPETTKLRTKLKKYTPTGLSHWRVDLDNPMAKGLKELKKDHPDVISANFYAEQGYLYPDMTNTTNPQLQERLDPSRPEEYWSVSLREAMALETGAYEQESPETGETEQFAVEDTVVERQIAAEIPGPGPSRSPITRTPSPQGSPVARSPSPQQTRQMSPEYRSPPSQFGPLPAIQIQSASPPMSPVGGLPPLPVIPVEPVEYPEYEHTVDVQMVRPPRMQSPVGEIDAQQAIYMQRVVQATPEGTTVATQLRGTQAEGPGQARQIDITKVDRMPASSPSTSPRIGHPSGEYPSYGPSQIMQTPRSPRRMPTSPTSHLQSSRMSPPGMQSMGMSPPGSPTTHTVQSASPHLQVTPVRMPISPTKVSPANTSIRLETSIPVPPSPAEASLNVVRRLVEEERYDVSVSQELPMSLSKKLNKLKKKPQSLRVLEETLDQSILTEEETETLKSDVVAGLMYIQEAGVSPRSSPQKSPAGSPVKTPSPAKEKPIEVSPAAPAPLDDIVVPLGEATAEDVAIVNEEISEVTAKGGEEIPTGDAYTETKKDETPPKQKEKKPPLRGELAEQKAPWEMDLDSLEDLVAGKVPVGWGKLPSDESVRKTAGRVEYILDVQKPDYHSCVQLRGSQLPAWFPGFYSVLPQVEGYVRLEKSPSKAFAAAWNLFSPYQTAEHSEVVIL